MHEKDLKAKDFMADMFNLPSKSDFITELNDEEISNLIFIKYFYGLKLNAKDKKNFNAFKKVVEHRKKKLSVQSIAKITKIPPTTILNWLNKENIPVVIRLAEHYYQLGKPERGLWLSINSTRGGLFTGPWIQVPKKVKNYGAIKNFLNKIGSNTQFFGYLLGVMVGDASKHGIKRNNRVTRRLQLRLTKRYDSNLGFGEYFCKCVKSLGLRIKRNKDCPPGKCNTGPFYAWHSQCSQLIQWIFEKCLGLKDNETTTYNPIKANWMLKADKRFKIAFIQGLADSDGFVDMNAMQVGIITSPNTRLIKGLLASLNINSKERFFTVNKLSALMIKVKEAYNLPIFNESVNSYRYQKVKKIYYANHIKGHWPIYLRERIDSYLDQRLKGTKLVEKILDEEKTIIRSTGINRRIKKLNVYDALEE